MRVTIRIVACAVLWTVAGYATAAVNIDKVTVEAGRVTIQGNTEESHEVVVRIDRHEKPMEWRSWGRGSVFEVVVEASNKMSLWGGKTGHGFVVTVKHGASKTGGNIMNITNVALTEGNPVVGTFAIRGKADLVTTDGVLTFADVTLKDGKKLPVSFRLEPKVVLANPPAMPTPGAVKTIPRPTRSRPKARFASARPDTATAAESRAWPCPPTAGSPSACGVAWFSGLFSPARVFDLTDGRCLYSLPNEPGSDTEAVGLSPDGKTLATKDDEFLYFRDAATGKELRKLKYLSDSGGGRSGTDWLTFTPDGKQAAVTLMGDEVQLIDVEAAKVTKTFAPGGAASACVFSPDGKLMATGGYEKVEGVYYARLWEVGTGKELRRFPAARFPTGNGVKRSLAFSPDGATLAGGGWGDARLHLWEAATGKELKVFPKIGEDIVSVAFAPDGKTVAAAADNIYLYDPVTGKERLRIERRARGLAFSRDGSVLTGAVSGAIYRWDAASGRQLTPAEAQDSAVEQILVSADGRRVFTTDQDGDLYVWDAAGGKSPRRIEEGVKLGVVASPDRRFLAWTVRDVLREQPDSALRRRGGPGHRPGLAQGFESSGAKLRGGVPAGWQVAPDARKVGPRPSGSGTSNPGRSGVRSR